MVVGIDRAAQHVTRFEINKLVRAGANRLEVGRCIARCSSLECFKNVLRNDHASGTHKRICPEWRRLLILNLDSMAVYLGDLHIFVRATGVSRSGGVGRISSRENNVIGSECNTVVPLNISFEFPSNGFAIPRYATVGQRGHFCRQDGH